MAPFRKFYKKRFSKAKAKAKPAGGVKAMCQKMIKMELHKAIENKQAQFREVGTNYNSACSGAGDVKRLVPLIGQGDTEVTRTGNQITARSLVIRGHLLLTPNDSQPRGNIRVRLMVLTPKSLPNTILSTANTGTWQDRILKDGTNFMGLNGTIPSLYLPVNSDAVTVHYDKQFTLSDTVTAQAGLPSLTGNFVVSDYSKGYKAFYINVRCKGKVLKYNEIIDNDPTNFGPVLCVSYVHLDSRYSPDVLDTALQVSYVSVLDFEDA